MFGFTKSVKLMGLLKRNWRDVTFVPLSIAFGYFHGAIKVYALFTLNKVSHLFIPPFPRFLLLFRHIGAAGDDDFRMFLGTPPVNNWPKPVNLQHRSVGI
jgi:hypothetical protein